MPPVACVLVLLFSISFTCLSFCCFASRGNSMFLTDRGKKHKSVLEKKTPADQSYSCPFCSRCTMCHVVARCYTSHLWFALRPILSFLIKEKSYLVAGRSVLNTCICLEAAMGFFGHKRFSNQPQYRSNSVNSLGLSINAEYLDDFTCGKLCHFLDSPRRAVIFEGVQVKRFWLLAQLLPQFVIR